MNKSPYSERKKKWQQLLFGLWMMVRTEFNRFRIHIYTIYFTIFVIHCCRCLLQPLPFRLSCHSYVYMFDLSWSLVGSYHSFLSLFFRTKIKFASSFSSAVYLESDFDVVCVCVCLCLELISIQKNEMRTSNKTNMEKK